VDIVVDKQQPEPTECQVCISGKGLMDEIIADKKVKMCKSCHNIVEIEQKQPSMNDIQRYDTMLNGTGYMIMVKKDNGMYMTVEDYNAKLDEIVADYKARQINSKCKCKLGLITEEVWRHDENVFLDILEIMEQRLKIRVVE